MSTPNTPDVEHFEITPEGVLHWFLNGFDFGPADHGPGTAAGAAYIEDQRDRGFDPWPASTSTCDVEYRYCTHTDGAVIRCTLPVHTGNQHRDGSHRDVTGEIMEWTVDPTN